MSSATLNSQALSSRMNYDWMSRFLSFIVQSDSSDIVLCATILIVVVRTILLNVQWFLLF